MGNIAPLPPREQIHPFLRYEGLEYTDADIADFEERLEGIYSRKIHRVQVVDFLGMPELMRDGLFDRIVMEHRDDVGGARRRLSWRQFILALGLHTREEMESPGFARDILTAGDFLGPPPSYTLIKDLVLRLCHRMMAHSIAGRSQAPEKFVARLAEHFGLLTAEILGGLTVIAPELPIIDMGELSAEDAPATDEGDQADQAPAQTPPPPLAATRTMPQKMARLEEDVHEIHGMLAKQRKVISAMARDFSRFCTWTTTSLARMMDREGVTYTSYYETPREYTRHVRCKTDGASTSAAQQDP
ncbi:hypothetical protein Tco_1093541 [Tanacetum coccineum]|uniref:Uncharacterized protein n=1 Tax=Tanacetum coccineum TaxID=301880 RepID=A0ABQ5ID26_9ASTR